MANKIVFIVDDEVNILELLNYNLINEGYITKTFTNGVEMLAELKISKPDLILLDLMLPQMSGTEICKKIRSDSRLNRIPIIMLTAKGEEFDKVLGLELGADDYVTKPFSVRELLARVKSAIRRIDMYKDPNKQIINIRNITIDVLKREAHLDDIKIQLTFKEFELLLLLVQNLGNVLSREVILNKVWGYDYIGETRTVDVHIRGLRKILGDDNENYIETIRGVGYKFKE